MDIIVKIGEKIKCDCGSYEFRIYEVVNEQGDVMTHSYRCASCDRWWWPKAG